MTKRVIRSYDDEFKSNAVSLYLSSGKSYSQLGSELGVSVSGLAGWVNSGRYHKDRLNRKVTEAELSELKKLRKELKHVRAERDILKKAVAIFTKPTKEKDLNS
jgi:Transposase.